MLVDSIRVGDQATCAISLQPKVIAQRLRVLHAQHARSTTTTYNQSQVAEILVLSLASQLIFFPVLFFLL